MGRFAGFLPEVMELVRRFPVAVLCCVLAFVFNVYVGDWFDAPATLGLLAAFLGAGAAHLFTESRRWTLSTSVVFAAVVAVSAGYLAYDPMLLQSYRLFLFLGLTLMLFVAPYVRRNVEQGAVWLFVMRLAFAALLALVVGLILMLGLLAIVSGLKFLFGIDLGETAWVWSSSLSILLVGPLFGLAMVPRNLDEVIDLAAHKGDLLERGISVLVNYIAVPLAIIYALLLHAYAVKIIALQIMPKGEVGLTVTLFAIAGTFAWLVAWPFRETGTRLLKLYSRYWFWFLPVPVGLLALAVWQRVGEYGMTPDRYGLILVALWAGLMCGYMMLRRSYADMRVIIGGAAVLLLLGSFGPLGAVGLTVYSHTARFESFLMENAMLENGELKAVLPVLAPDQKSKGKSLLEALQEVQGLGSAEVFLLTGEKFESNREIRFYVSDKVIRRFGLAQTKTVEKLPEPPVVAPLFSFRSNVEPISFPFSGEGQIVGPLHYPSCCSNSGNQRPKFLKRNGSVTMTIDATPGKPALSLSFAESTILKAIKAANSGATNEQRLPLFLTVDAKTSLVIIGGSGVYSDTKVELVSLSFWVIVKR